MLVVDGVLFVVLSSERLQLVAGFYVSDFAIFLRMRQHGRFYIGYLNRNPYHLIIQYCMMRERKVCVCLCLCLGGWVCWWILSQ